MNKVTEPRAVILDFDGVIVNSQRYHIEAWSQAYLAVSGSTLPLGIDLSGRSADTIAKMLARAAPILISQQHLKEEKESCLLTLATKVNVIPAAIDLIMECQNRVIPWGIASNGSSEFIELICQKFQLKPDAILVANQCQKPKPYPEIWFRCASRLGVPLDMHKHTWVVDDIMKHANAASRSGFIGYYFGGLRPAGHSKSSPMEVTTINDMAELVALLKLSK